MTSDRGPWMSTFTGKRFYFLDPRVEDIDIDDIVHSIARIPRFGGHTIGQIPYPVGQHAVHVAERLHLAGASSRVVFAGLHHDDREVYFGDMIAPLKIAARDGSTTRSVLEDRCQAEIDQALGIPELTAEEYALIKAADERMLVTEARDLMAGQGAGWSVKAEPYADMRITPWSIEDTEMVFRHWHEMTAAMVRAEAR